MTKWVEALKIWNGKKGGPWCVPRKGSPEHAEVKAIMAGAPTKLKADHKELIEAMEGKQEVKKFKPRITEEAKKRIEEKKVESKKEKVKGFLKKAIEKHRVKKNAKKEEKPKNEMIMPKEESGPDTRRQEVNEVRRIKTLAALLKKSDDRERGVSSVEEKGKYLYTLHHNNDGSKIIEKQVYGEDLRHNRHNEPFDAGELRFLKKVGYKMTTEPHKVKNTSLELSLGPREQMTAVKTEKAMNIEEPNKEQRVLELKQNIQELKKKIAKADKSERESLQDRLERFQHALQLYSKKGLNLAVLDEMINTITGELYNADFKELKSETKRVASGDTIYVFERKVTSTQKRDEYNIPYTRHDVTWTISKFIRKEGGKLIKDVAAPFTAQEKKTLNRNEIRDFNDKGNSVSVSRHSIH